MKNKGSKTITRIVGVSVISLMLSVSMFVGTTFAWFTNTVTSSNNKIMSGSLRIDLQVMDEDGVYQSVDDMNSALFDYDLWEPGYTQVANVRVVNDGTLALRYEVQVEAPGIVEDLLENQTMLSDVIDVYYTDTELILSERYQLAEALADGKIKNIGTLTQVLLSGMLVKDFLLPANASSTEDYSKAYATVVLRMRTDAGEEYENLSVGEGFDIRLIATQHTYEEDSFDNQYDAQIQRGLIFDDGNTHEVNATVTLGKGSEYTDVITARNSGTIVNITGGYYDVTSNDCAVWAEKGAVVNIYDGMFLCDGLGVEATSDNHQDLIYAGDGGIINIYGGMFMSKSEGAWLANQKDNKGKMFIYGGTFVDWNPADNLSEGENTNFVASGKALLVSKKGTSTYYSVLPADNAIKDNGNGDVEILGNVTMIDVPLFRDSLREEGYTFNGNGYTVDLQQLPGHKFVNNSWYPEDTTLFTTKDGDLVTVNDINFTGESSYILAGDFVNRRYNTQTVFNNVNIFDFKTVQLNKWCTAFNACGKVWLNNCTITGTTRSEFSTAYDASVPYVLSMLVSNGSETFVNGGRYDSIYLDNSAMCEIRGATVDVVYTEAWGQSNDYVLVGQDAYVKRVEVRFARARIKIEDNAVVDVLDLTKTTKAYSGRIKIADTATVGKIIAGDKEFASYDEWYAWINA